MLALGDLAKTFRGTAGQPVRAVDHIDLGVGSGEVVAFLGPNGAGKTTTLDMVLGLTEPSSGSVEIFGRPPREAVSAGRISAVLQSGGLLVDLTVRETMRMIASTLKRPADVDDVLGRVGIAHLSGRRVSKCSGGEQQRLRFALSLLPDPDLLVLDEPTAGMDVAARRQFWDTMHQEASAGRTVIFATHYLQEADEFADRIVLIARGRIVADGPTEEIRARANGRRVSADLPQRGWPSAQATLRATDGVLDVRAAGCRVTVTTTDSDTVSRLILNDLGGSDLEVASGSLEDAFMTLTDEPADEPAEEAAGDPAGDERQEQPA